MAAPPAATGLDTIRRRVEAAQRGEVFDSIKEARTPTDAEVSEMMNAFNA